MRYLSSHHYAFGGLNENHSQRGMGRDIIFMFTRGVSCRFESLIEIVIYLPSIGGGVGACLRQALSQLFQGFSGVMERETHRQYTSETPHQEEISPCTYKAKTHLQYT